MEKKYVVAKGREIYTESLYILFWKDLHSTFISQSASPRQDIWWDVFKTDIFSRLESDTTESVEHNFEGMFFCYEKHKM